jgi:AbrB family looped-hinge helix DNA binding protein
MPTITYATLWAKWQIVIPKEARDKLHVWPWDKVVLIIEDGRLMIINPDGVQHMITILQEGMKQDEEKKESRKIGKKSEKSEKKKK